MVRNRMPGGVRGRGCEAPAYSMCARQGTLYLSSELFLTTSWTFVNENSSIIADFNLPSKSYFHWS
ncbi:MAG: hypothetical protein V3R57_01355 [Candidatus Bathyarchaeia archaeon]